MTEAGEGNHDGCCGHGAAAGTAGDVSQFAQDATCSGPGHAAEACSDHAGLCGADEAACCGGHAAGGVDDMFAFPTTTEVVSVPAVQLAGLLDLVEKLAAEPDGLAEESDYVAGQRLLAEQAPQLVALREQFLERMKALLGDALAMQSPTN